MAELMGTYVIIFIGCGSLMIEVKYGISPVGVAVAWGLVVMVMIYALGHVSGGHFNPAITIAFAVSCKFPWRQVSIICNGFFRFLKPLVHLPGDFGRFQDMWHPN